MKKDFPVYIQRLIDRYIDGSISEDEMKQLDAWYDQFDDRAVEVWSEKVPAVLKAQLRDRIRHSVDLIEEEAWREKLGEKHVRPGAVRWKWSVAASVILLMGIGFWWMLDRSGSPGVGSGKFALEHMEEMAAPVKNAYLLLPDSSRIDFSDQFSRIRAQETMGLVVDEAGVAHFAGHGMPHGSLSTPETPALQQLIVPKGNQFEVYLPDGTRVWLNAGSRLEFPTVFNGNERHVTLEGEAYFEVHSDRNHPFIVHTNYQQLRVTGTKFNVSSYKEDGWDKTALFEGRVEIVHRTTGKTVRLLPGELGMVDGRSVDIAAFGGSGEEISAWKSNTFVFDQEHLSDVMRKLARWYPIDYDLGELASRENRYSGKIRKDAGLKEVLTMLGLVAGIEFHMEGDRLIAVPKTE